ncbi:MAG: S-layer homology domain-containing protein [Clostridiales bacterium]|jgi:hypothetical protein|nr:S-layer homology domain-containing protein [Clostridiales bacterium]
MKIFITIILCTAALLQSGFASEPTDGIDGLLNGYYGDNAAYGGGHFSDLGDAPWAAEAVSRLASYGVVAGDGAYFFPLRAITRDEFVKILILGFGLYDDSAKCDFKDVPKDGWQYPYIATANKLGITSGVGGGRFGAGEQLTRQQMMTLAYNAAKYAGVTFLGTEDKVFADRAALDDYAVEAANALGRSGIVTGDALGRLNPRDYATRAEACKIVFMLAENNT